VPGVTDPNEVYFKDGLWGWATSAWERLYSFANLLGIASHGWDGSGWHKDPLRLGFSEQYLELEEGTGDGGNLEQNFTVVPAGEVWIVTAFSCFPVSGAHGSAVVMRIYDGTDNHTFRVAPSLAQNTSLVCPTPLVLVEGDKLRVVWISAANGDEFRAYANGRKILIAE
jgi:hypothetical protein